MSRAIFTACSGPSITSVYRYYHEGPATVLGAFEWTPLAGAAAADRFCDERLSGVERCWIVLGREWDFDPRGCLLPALGRSGHLTREQDFPGVRLYSWSRTAPAR